MVKIATIFVFYEDKYIYTVVINGGGLNHGAVLYQKDCAKILWYSCQAVFILCYMSFSGLLMPGLCVYLYRWRLFSVQERPCLCQGDGGMW